VLTPAPPQIDISLVVIITVFSVGVCACSRGGFARQRTSACILTHASLPCTVTHCRYTVFFPTIVLAQNFLVIIQRACCAPAAC
jgi:hypothetical protein